MPTVAMNFTGISGYADQGSSDQYVSAARYIDQERKKVSSHLHKSKALSFIGRGTLQELQKTLEECSLGGWDGERAKPVTREVWWNARVFLWSFPLGIESPEIGAEPDGAITLEWYRSPSRVISISINPGGRLYFAAIIGGERRHGDGFALFEVSEDLVKLIENVTSENV